MKRLAILLAVVACNTPAKPEIRNDAPVVASGSASMVQGTASAAGADPTAKAGTALRVVHATQDSDALSLIRTERLKQKAQEHVLVVYVGATWCPPCKKFKEEIASGRLDGRLAKITLLEFDADRDAERLSAAGYTFKFVPFVALPGADGRPAESQEATGAGSNAWTELLGKLDAWQK